MAISQNELDAFYQFALHNGDSLEEALSAFRANQQWAPKTPLGQKLKQLRSQFIAEGGDLLTADEVAAEVRDRRGSHFSES